MDRLIRWVRCETDAERLDVYNGLLLAAPLDAAFDAGLISFADGGQILIAPAFTEDDQNAIGIHDWQCLRHVAPAHRANLAWHRRTLFGAL